MVLLECPQAWRQRKLSDWPLSVVRWRPVATPDSYLPMKKDISRQHLDQANSAGPLSARKGNMRWRLRHREKDPKPAPRYAEASSASAPRHSSPKHRGRGRWAAMPRMRSGVKGSRAQRQGRAWLETQALEQCRVGPITPRATASPGLGAIDVGNARRDRLRSLDATLLGMGLGRRNYAVARPWTRGRLRETAALVIRNDHDHQRRPGLLPGQGRH